MEHEGQGDSRDFRLKLSSHSRRKYAITCHNPRCEEKVPCTKRPNALRHWRRELAYATNLESKPRLGTTFDAGFNSVFASCGTVSGWLMNGRCELWEFCAGRWTLTMVDFVFRAFENVFIWIWDFTDLGGLEKLRVRRKLRNLGNSGDMSLMNVGILINARDLINRGNVTNSRSLENLKKLRNFGDLGNLINLRKIW